MSSDHFFSSKKLETVSEKQHANRKQPFNSVKDTKKQYGRMFAQKQDMHKGHILPYFVQILPF